MSLDQSLPKVLIAGGGVAGLEAALALHELAADRVSIELLRPHLEFIYRPQAVREPFELGERSRYSLHQILPSGGVLEHLGTLKEVDPLERRVRTEPGEEIGYDVLLVAVGAASVPAVAGAITFRDDHPGPVNRVVEGVRAGRIQQIAFVVPSRVAWPLPAYELALMTAVEAKAHGQDTIEISLVTPEAEPLGIFGHRASKAVGDLLDARGIDVRLSSHVDRVVDGRLAVHPSGRELQVDRVVALPRPRGPRIGGLPHDEEGFLPVDQHSRVLGVEHVYAAGDVTTFPVKQGGLAAQQADAAAEVIAATVGALLEPRPFRPVLRGLLMTRAEPQHLRAAITGGQGETSTAQDHALWRPSAKIAARYLSPRLATLDRTRHRAIAPDESGALEIDLELRDLSPV